MRKVDERKTPSEPTPPAPPKPRRKRPTIELDESDLIEVCDRVIEPGIVVPRTPPANDAERRFFAWTPESLITIAERLGAGPHAEASPSEN